MSRVLDEILHSFYTKLSESDALNETTVEEIRALFASKKRLKADELVAIVERTTREETRDSS